MELVERSMAKQKRIPHKFLPWIDVRKTYQLSHAHVQMARELGLSPKRFSKYADRKEQPWKRPLPEFIEHLYEAQFGKSRPDVIQSIEDLAAAHVAKRVARKNRQQASQTAELAPQADAELAPQVDAPVQTDE